MECLRPPAHPTNTPPLMEHGNAQSLGERETPSLKQFLSRTQRTRIPSARSNGRLLDAEVPHVCCQLPAGRTMRVANASTRQGFKLGR
ncbi:hypothetical protein SRHO_G00245660 [Serrasalmus rhombeus]